MAQGGETDAVASARRTVASARHAFASGRTRPLEWRREQLRAIERFLDNEAAVLAGAVAEDLRRAPAETFLAELHTTMADVRELRRHLRSWTRARRAGVSPMLRPARARLYREPLGVVVVIGPWNYPVNLVLAPLAAAVAAGNAAVLKPSELAPATAAVLLERLGSYLDRDAVRVVTGGASTSEALIGAGVDHVFFTGSAAVGRLVMAQCAATLTPLTLELGGKSPVLVDERVDLEVAARRIAWGKFLNAGQSCIAPDYVLVDERREDELLAALVSATHELFGERPQHSADLARIVNDHHLARLERLLDDHGGRVVLGGDIDRADRFLAPTIIAGPRRESALMREEIFGPILPVIAVADLEREAELVNEGPTPLALYVFSADRARARRLVATVRSGTACVNTTMQQFVAASLPFGGVGESGTGQYHGRAGIERLSQLRPVLTKATRPDLRVAYPPYERRLARLARRALGERRGAPTGH